jgi:hypothetical protein
LTWSSWRRLAAAGAAAAFAALGSAAAGTAAHGDPIHHQGHRDCHSFGFEGELVVEPVVEGTYGDANMFQATISNIRVEDGVFVFDWSANTSVGYVVVESGDDGFAYGYGTDTSDTGVAAPGVHADRVLFCFHPHHTAVTVATFAARRTAQGVVLTWRTASETTALGYVVYRQSGTKRVRLNRALIQASGPHTYRFVDRTSKGHARYWLRAISLDEVAWYGPAQA